MIFFSVTRPRVVDHRRQRTAVVELTTDSGGHWRRVEPSGLPDRSCSVVGVSAATPRDAWIVARVGRGTDTALFHTHDGGRTWARDPLLSR
jgi:photosystem II stability/assembly factor-like uncharacterized protein